MSAPHPRADQPNSVRPPSTLPAGLAQPKQAAAPPPEHFIPVRQAELVALLCAEPQLSPADQAALRRVAERLADTLHVEYHQQLAALKADYAPFDPDADTVPVLPPSAADRSRRLDDLFQRFGWLLERANFTRLSSDALQEALAGRSHWGLNLVVDFSVFDRLDIYVRGETVEQIPRRDWRTLFRPRNVDVAAFQRLVVILKLRANPRTRGIVDTEDVHVKLFKDIPRMDLEMLLPGTQVKMSLVDRTKIVLPTLSGLALTFWKVFTGAVIIAASGMYNAVALCGLLGGSIGYGLRSFHGYLQTKQRYQLSLTESLYYQNLDNNAGVMMRLLDEAEEQENREALLAYYFLWRHAPATGFTPAELDARIEEFLVEKLKRPVDFEVADAVDKLVRFRLAEVLPGGRLCARPLAEAIRTLDQSWDQLRGTQDTGWEP
jgi:hypothetical protein